MTNRIEEPSLCSEVNSQQFRTIKAAIKGSKGEEHNGEDEEEPEHLTGGEGHLQQSLSHLSLSRRRKTGTSKPIFFRNTANNDDPIIVFARSAYASEVKTAVIKQIAAQVCEYLDRLPMLLDLRFHF